MAALDDISAWLISNGYCTAVGTDLFWGAKAAIPTGDGVYTSLIPTGGAGALRTHSSKYPRPSLQVMVRAKLSSAARVKAETLHAFMDGNYNVTLSGTLYQSITAVQEVLDMQLDDAKLHRWSFNINAVRSA